MSLSSELAIKYASLLKECFALRKEKDSLPNGSIQEKSRNNHHYYYLAHRDEWGDVVYDYVNSDNIEQVRKSVALRKELTERLRDVTDEFHQYEKALGRKKANLNYIKSTVNELINGQNDWEIKRIELFGSRATSKFRDDSDADFIIEYGFGKHPSVWDLSGLRIALSEALGMDVDIVLSDAIEGSHLEIGKREVIYEAPGSYCAGENISANEEKPNT